MAIRFRLLAPIRAFLDAVNNRRYKKIINDTLLPFLKDGSHVLDIGCNDGYLANLLIKKNQTLHIIGADVQITHQGYIPSVIYDGKNLPFPDASYDVVMAVDVLHHTEDIMVVLREMSRVSKYNVLIKDHVWDGNRITWMILSFFDWCTNAPYGIRCAYNYPTFDQWQRYFNALSLTIQEYTQVSNFPFQLNKKFNYIYSLIKYKHD
jgi:ubiquinone/menaquinone biosynthesis C-methylase UbiE